MAKRNVSTATRKFGRGKELLFTGIILLSLLLLAELALRTLLTFQLGPRVLLYGTSIYRNAEAGEVVRYGTRFASLEGYEKYFPNQSVRATNCLDGQVFDVTINADGFRGPDFDRPKPPGTIRIVTLGASSTFGFCDKDDETYPVQLDTLLKEQSPRYEVINLGIPHLTSGQIASLFFNEALALEPDVVTFYEGHNDTHALKEEPRRRTARFPAVHSTIAAVGRYSVIFLRIASILEEAPQGFTADYLYEPAAVASKEFLSNLELIRAECLDREILFVVATQQMRSLLIDRPELRGVTYDDEVRLVEAKLETEGRLNHREFGFLVHDIFMTALVDWAATNDVPLVDVIAALDQRRDSIMSPVHINEFGNEIIARAFLGEILARVPK